MSLGEYNFSDELIFGSVRGRKSQIFGVSAISLCPNVPSPIEIFVLLETSGENDRSLGIIRCLAAAPERGCRILLSFATFILPQPSSCSLPLSLLWNKLIFSALPLVKLRKFSLISDANASCRSSHDDTLSVSFSNA
uniref:Uncharacterized protein n=1 Tax=Lutzomyia longipalpis TaxID=7200 RepID=A0A1B0CKN6_LUTLO